MIIVTGGAGFIGSNLVHRLNSAGRSDIVIVDSLLDSAKHANLAGARFIDYFDIDEFLQAMPGLDPVEAVFHQGACAVTTEQDGRYMMENNYSFSKRLLHECLRREIRFIYASSAAVYGHGAEPFRENGSAERPLNVYGFSKLAFDHHVNYCLPRANSPVVGLRYFNVYGPRESHKGDMASVIFKMVRQHQADETLKLFAGSDRFLRDFVHVDDIAAVNLHFLNHDRSGIFNCGTGIARSFLELGELVAGNLEGARIETIEMPARLESQYQRYTCSDNALLRSAGYDGAFRSLEEGVASYVGLLANTHAPLG